MRATVWYRHEESNHIHQGPYRKSDTDELFIQFIPDEGETLTFPDGESMIPYSKIVEWANAASAE